MVDVAQPVVVAAGKGFEVGLLRAEHDAGAREEGIRGGDRKGHDVAVCERDEERRGLGGEDLRQEYGLRDGRGVVADDGTG